MTHHSPRSIDRGFGGVDVAHLGCNVLPREKVDDFPFWEDI